MYYDLSVLDGIEIEILNPQIWIEIPNWIKLIPRDCAIHLFTVSISICNLQNFTTE